MANLRLYSRLQIGESHIQNCLALNTMYYASLPDNIDIKGIKNIFVFKKCQYIFTLFDLTIFCGNLLQGVQYYGAPKSPKKENSKCAGLLVQ